ncbi:hypothetical protein SKAU_G00283840 [Synaphobranchus kaupii]|uniref:Uncharacterized protein n=1 Tax=Synaphobranchus kaupii TaxID=118154 RepID=A0A9Q1EXK1_SYNKA|nr:hypothetical protein SKAU_G00283840 [Synaphobranchus kaupii]
MCAGSGARTAEEILSNNGTTGWSWKLWTFEVRDDLIPQATERVERVRNSRHGIEPMSGCCPLFRQI